MRVALLSGPAELGQLLEGAVISRRLRGSYDVIVLFAQWRAVLERRLPAALPAREERGALWLAWPKRASGVETDLDDRTVREIGLATGLVDVKVCAIDETWSGLRFVARKGRSRR